MPLRYFAPAKINLSLDLGPVRPDGYHEVRTVLQAVSLGDRLLVAPCSRPEVVNPGVPRGDLVTRAMQLFAQRTGVSPGLRITVIKRIPIGAGLGGGSSDAACTLRLLRDAYCKDLPEEELFTMARALGSDVPFFLGRSPLALATGRGEQIQPLRPLPPRYVVIAWPGEALSTALVYDRSAAGPGGASDAVVRGAPQARNDLAKAAQSLSPRLRRLLAEARAQGVRLHVTGSGSAAFALFPESMEAGAALRRLRPLAPRVLLCQTLGRWPWQGNAGESNE